MKHHEFEISQFLDNELPIVEQKTLFSHLSVCDECSKAMSDLIKIKQGVKSVYDEMHVELKDYSSLTTLLESGRKKRNIYRTMFYTVTAASILLGFFLILLEGNYSSLENKYLQLQSEGSRLQDKYTMALNENKRLSEMNKNNFDKMNFLVAKYKIGEPVTLKSPPMKSATKIIASSNKKRIPTGVMYGSLEKITKEDFLVPQIIGN